MTAKIKLNAASGGGSFSLQAPSSSSNNRVFTLPDSADATILTSTTDLGKLAKSFIDKGELVPDEVTIQMLESEVNKFNDSNGFIFDGFPRTAQQADALDTYLHSIGTEVTKMVALNVPEEELVKRLLNRGKESGRTDDQNEDVISNRIQVYEKNTAVLADFYQAQSKLENVNGVGTVEEVTNRIFSAIDN